MRTAIDAAGRVVIPKALRDVLGLSAGQTLEVELHDGRLEINVPATRVELELTDGWPQLTAETAEALTAEQVRQTLETSRR